MTTNPYEASQNWPAPSRGRWSRLKSPILLFVVGFLAAWTIWTIWNYAAYSPKDFSRHLPKTGEFRNEEYDWLKNAKSRKVGEFTIIAAGDRQTASAWIFPTKRNHKPLVEYFDYDSDGSADQLVVSDGKSAFSFHIADEAFESFSYSAHNFSIDEVSYDDYDMDGRFDFRLGPGRRMALMVDAEWREVILEGGGKGYVEVDGKRRAVEYVNGKWRVEPTAEAKD
jgi:hypothetical protein